MIDWYKLKTITFGIGVGAVFGIGWSVNSAYADFDAQQEQHYQNGYSAYSKKNYGVCADEFFLTGLDSSDKGNRARLFLAFCQERIGLKDLAAYHVQMLDDDHFTTEEKKLLQWLENALKSKLEAYYRPYFWVFPYYGAGFFSDNSAKSSASILGAAGSITYRDWGLSLGGEHLDMAFRQSTSSYNQNQFAAGINKAFGSQWFLRGNFTYLNASTSTLSTIVGGGGLTFVPWFGTAFGVEYDNSTYANLLGGLTANQMSFTYDQRLWSNLTSVISIQGLVQAILPTAPQKSDSTTSFTLQSSYLRYALDLELYLSGLKIGALGWIGNEAFGVRSQGNLIFNALENHTFGWTGKLGYQFTPLFSVQGAFSQEGFNAYGVNSTSSTVVGGITLNF